MNQKSDKVSEKLGGECPCDKCAGNNGVFCKCIHDKAETEKAFGGCKNCYGKGYATVRYGYEGYDDFAHEGYVDPVKMNIHPCKCSRGKDIEKILSSAKAEGRKEMLTKITETIKSMKHRPDNAIMDIWRENENKVLNGVLIALQSLTPTK